MEHEMNDRIACLKDEKKELVTITKDLKIQITAANITIKEKQDRIIKLESQLQDYTENENMRIEKKQTFALKSLAIESPYYTEDHDEVSAGEWSPKFTPKKLHVSNSPGVLPSPEKLKQSMVEEVNRAKSALKQAQRELKTEKAEKDNVKRMYERVTSQLKTVSEELQSLRKRCASLDQRTEELQYVNQKLEEEASHHILDAEALRQSVEEHKTTSITSSIKTERYEGRIDDLERSIKYYKVDIRKLKSDITALKTKEKDWMVEKTNLETFIGELEQQIMELKQSKQVTMDELNAKSRSEQVIIDMIHERLNESQLDILGKHHGENRDLRDLPSYFRMFIKSMDKSKTALQEQNNKLETKCNYMKNSINQLNDAKSAIDDHLQRFEKTSKVLRQRIVELENVNKSLTQENSKTKKENKDQELMIDQLKGALSQEKKERKTARDAIETAVKKSAVRINECKLLRSKVSKLDGKLKDAVLQNSALMDQLQDMSIQVKQSHYQIEIMKEEKNNYVENERMFREALNNSVQSLRNVSGQEDTIHATGKQSSFGFMDET